MFMRHRFAVLIVALAGSAVFAQSPPASVVGTVESVSGNVIHVETGAQPLALYTDARTEVWKGNVFHDLSQVAVGDKITARYRMDVSGKPVAEAVWLNITMFSAVVTKVTGARFEVLTNPKADPQSACRKENKTIDVDADTVFEASAREDLRPGRDVDVVGLVLGNGEVRATRVTVYEGNRPVRMRSDAVIIRPDGSRQ